MNYPNKFVCYVHFIAWTQISFGITFDFKNFNFEIHLPFCFIKIGWTEYYPKKLIENWEEVHKNTYGLFH